MKYLLIFVVIFAHAFSHDIFYQSLDELALSAGTTKSSACHYYTKVYEKFFEVLREKQIRFLEIGIYKGDSVKMWEQYFPNAELHFIDINLDKCEHFSERSRYHLIDQSNITALQTFGNNVGEFDIIIDDGGHTMVQQINSFKALFPFVKKGGFYVIEDLHSSYWKAYGGHGTLERPKAGKNTCVEFLKQLVEKVNFSGARTRCADIEKCSETLRSTFDYEQAHIAGIYFFSSLCIIEKY